MNRSHLTAIKRKSLPRPVRSSLKYLAGRILDYGCGHGIVEDKLGNNYDVVSYDPYYRTEKPIGEFDTVLCVYVLNVISILERLQVLFDIYDYIRDEGILVVAVRMKSAVDYCAKRNSWESMSDGFMSHVGTFQKGFTKDNIVSLVECAGFKFLEQADISTFVFKRRVASDIN